MYLLLNFNQLFSPQTQPSDVFSKKVSIKILQNSQENTCAGILFFTKIVGNQNTVCWDANFLQKRQTTLDVIIFFYLFIIFLTK